MSRRLGGPLSAWLALSALLVICFGRLVVEPSALIVDANHPSVDHARVVEDVSPGNDLTRLFLPHHLAIAQHLAVEGHVPGWDDRGFGGRPLVGNPQAGLFYPPVWFAWRSGAPSALGWITVGHLFWAALGTFLLARTLKMGGWGALVASGCVQVSPYVLGQVFEGHYPHVWAFAWYPWAFAATIRLRRGEVRFALALPPILAATFLAGHPQEGYYLAITLAIWAIRDALVELWGGRGRESWRLLACWAGVIALTLGLVSVELIPDLWAQGWTLRGARHSVRLASGYHLNPINALQLLSPRALGGPGDYFGHDNSWESLTSIGLVPLLLAAIAVARAPQRLAVRGWLILAVAALVFACGRSLGLFTLMYYLLPGMDRFRVPSRALFLASLAVSMLAGYGVNTIRSRSIRPGSWERLALKAWVAAGLLAIVVEGGRWVAQSRDLASRVLESESDRWLLGLARLSGETTFWVALGGSTLLLSWARWRPSRRRVVASALGLLALVELGLYGHATIVTTPVDRFLDPDPISESLLLASRTDFGPPRIRAVDSLYDDLRAGRIGLSKTNVNDSFQIQHAADLYQKLYHIFEADRFDRGEPMDAVVAARSRAISQSVLDRMSVSLLVSDRIDPDAPWQLLTSGLWQGSTYVVSQNPTAMPRAYVVPRAELAHDGPRMVPLFAEVDPRSAVLMPQDPLGANHGQRQPFTPATWRSTDPDRVVIQVKTEAPGLLVVADTWMPGWSSTVDGRDTPVLRGNRAQRVIPLREPGSHTVVMSYRPPGLIAGVALTTATATVWLALFLLYPAVAIRRRSRSSATARTMMAPMITS